MALPRKKQARRKVMKAKKAPVQKRKSVNRRQAGKLMLALKNKTKKAGASGSKAMPRWQNFTPSKIDHSKCLARIWGNGCGGQCTHKPVKKGKSFCAAHLEKWKVHGKVTGPIPIAKLMEFQRTKDRGKTTGKPRPSTIVAIKGGPRKVIQKGSQENKTTKSADGSTTQTKTNHKEKAVSCKWSGAKVERKSVTQKSKLYKTKAGRIIEEDWMIVRRVRYR
eukprot:TRINITY_DN13052_c3_g1_i1.p1 TRINITY_DN13052_c3_g1~~TRINITY_DN13052_c3_g1_i1.p1  ORF type:complete len:248 (-),score=32.68 TRINITY_DN13052_c3_g1_i1:170-832(-)